MISDLDMLNDLLITKNKYYDKSPGTANILYALMGEALVFRRSDEEWSIRRKHISVAFYKEKLLKFSEIIKDILIKRMKMWREKYVNGGKEMDFVMEMLDLHEDIFLTCVFGRDINAITVDVEENGKTT